MIAGLGLRISDAFRKTAPDPFVLAVLMTALTFVLVWALTDTSMIAAVDTWAGTGGVWSPGLLKFAMQMCLILVTGHALASSPPVARLLARLASLPRSPGQAVVLVALIAGGLGIFNWGLGLVAGAIMARRVGVAMDQRGVRVHYPLLAAAGYVGMMLWHGGFSGSAPLKVTTDSDISDIFGPDAPFGVLSIRETLLSPLNVFVTGGLLVLVPMLLMWLCPKDRDMQVASSFGVTEFGGGSLQSDQPNGKPILPRLLEDTPIVTVILAGLIAVWAWRYYLPGVDPSTGEQATSGLMSLTPDTVNMTMLLLGLVLHGTPMRYVRAVEDAAMGCAGIILQFPLYAGIMGLMATSGLTLMMAEGIASSANATTLPVMTLFSASVINLFVPSGGGQWAVQGPIAMRVAAEVGVDPAKMVMAVAYGDELTNMLQPFWALPLLAITGVKARDIVGYTAIVMLAGAAWMVIGLLAF